MEGKTTRTWTEVLEMLRWLQDSLVVAHQNGCCSRCKEPYQECLINMHSEEADIGCCAVGKDASLFVSQPDGCLESCRVTAGGKILGNGVWLCFICCPLQGGSNLQPTHEPANPKPVFLNLNPKKLFCLDHGLGRPLALSVGQLPDEVTGLSTMDPICVGSVRFGI